MTNELKNQNDTRVQILRLYFRTVGIEACYASPNLVAKVCYDYYPFWELTSDDIVYISDKL